MTIALEPSSPAFLAVIEEAQALLAMDPASKEAQRAHWSLMWRLLNLGVADTVWRLKDSSPSLVVMDGAYRQHPFPLRASRADCERWYAHWTNVEVCWGASLCPLELCQSLALPLDMKHKIWPREEQEEVSILSSSHVFHDSRGDWLPDLTALPLCAAVEQQDLEGLAALVEAGKACTSEVWTRWEDCLRQANLKHTSRGGLSAIAGVLLEGSALDLAFQSLGKNRYWVCTPVMVEALEKRLGDQMEPLLLPPLILGAGVGHVTEQVTMLQFAFLSGHFPLLEALVLAGARTDAKVAASAMPNWTLELALAGKYSPDWFGEEGEFVRRMFDEETGHPKWWSDDESGPIRGLVAARRLEKQLEDSLPHQAPRRPGPRL